MSQFAQDESARWEEALGADVGGPEQIEVSAEIAQIILLLRTSAEFFIEFFLPELDFKVPRFHKDVWGLLTDTLRARILLAIPRDHAKTTLAKLCVVWYFLFTSHRFCVYVSNTNTKAKDACRDIIGFLQSGNFIKVFGHIRIIKASETESIWMFELKLPGGRVKRCILRAIGTGQDMRGINVDNQRPDIAVCDDIESDDNTSSELLQQKTDRWVMGPFIKALARQKKIIWLGNMLQKTSLLARFSRMPKWNPVVFGCLVREPESGALVSLWPDRWPLPELVEDFNEYRTLGMIETWMCEMMNMPGHGRNGFTADQAYMLPKPLPDDIRASFLVLDPAFGEEAHNDDSSITAHVITEDGLPMIVEHVTGKLSEADMFETLLYFAIRWNAWVWGIEAVAAQKVLISLFSVFLSMRSLNHHVEMLPLLAGKGDPKVSRIRGFVSLMGKKEYAISEDMVEFVTQMMAYNMSKKSNRDDLLDSGAYGPQMLQQYLPIIMAASSGKLFEQPKPRFGTEVSSV